MVIDKECVSNKDTNSVYVLLAFQRVVFILWIFEVHGTNNLTIIPLFNKWEFVQLFLNISANFEDVKMVDHSLKIQRLVIFSNTLT